MITGFITFMLVTFYQLPFGGLLSVFCSFVAFSGYNAFLKVKLRKI